MRDENEARLDKAHHLQNEGRFPEAILEYEDILRSLPNHLETLYHLAAAHAKLNDIQNAIKHYQSTLQLAPDFWPAHVHLGLLYLKQHQQKEAMSHFKQTLELAPNHPEAHFYMGVLHLETNALDDAEDAFQHVLETNPEHIQAIINLGVVALKREEGQQAVTRFTKALTLDNNNKDARNNLAATFMHHDRFENALIHYDVLLKDDPNNIDYLYNMGVAQMALGHLSEASAHFEALLTHQKNHFAALNNLAAIHIRLGARDKAIVLLQLALLANPSDEASHFMLSALKPTQKTPSACPTYVFNLFNNYALYYDQHMQNTLNYTLPQCIWSQLHRQNIHRVQRTLDLGCGTGLCGAVLRECSDHLTGVDLSTKMLSHAKQKATYDTLIEDELVHFLQHDKEHYDLVVAADVLPYLGDLEPLFTTLKTRMMSKGVFMFTHELSEKAPFQLQDSARFSHHPDYIKTLCDGFETIHQEKVVARTQNQQGLPVILYVLKREI